MKRILTALLVLVATVMMAASSPASALAVDCTLPVGQSCQYTSINLGNAFIQNTNTDLAATVQIVPGNARLEIDPGASTNYVMSSNPTTVANVSSFSSVVVEVTFTPLAD